MRRVLVSLLAALFGSASTIALAQENYPNRPITLVSPITAGAALDGITRAWMNCAADPSRAGKPFVLINKPGANGVVAANAFRQSPADGYTIMLAGMSQTVITPYTYKKMPFDPEKDFEGAAMFAEINLVLVATPESGIKTIADLREYAKSRGNIDMIVPARAGPAHLLSEALSAKLGIKSTMVVVGGEPNAITYLMGNQAPVTILLSGTAAQYVESGKFVPIMSFSEKRLAKYPNTPSAVEALNDRSFVRSPWVGITTKAGTPLEVRNLLDKWTEECLKTPEFRTALDNLQATPKYVSRSNYAKVIRDDVVFWKDWIQKAGISVD